jgi:hypothetical protein
MVSDESTRQPVRSPTCRCGTLEQLAAEPGSPVVFDDDLREYHLRWQNAEGKKGSSRIYHCPFCGAAAASSRRASPYAEVPMDEVLRLRDLTRRLATIQQAIAALGEPQADVSEGITIQTPATHDRPSKAASYRTLTFTHLSDVADVVLIDYGVHGIKFTFNGKYLGSRASGPTSGCS